MPLGFRHCPMWAVFTLCMLAVIGCTRASDQCMAQTTVEPTRQTPALERLKGVRAVWHNNRALNASSMELLKKQAWEMFDHGFSNYMKHAFPKDNLLPVSCGGQDWQGGLALTLVDSLDMLLLLNRRGDILEAVEHLRVVLDFDKDVKVHVFETTIRVLGGLLSGHVLLAADPGLAPGYDNLLLHKASDLGDRLLAAFNTPSGLPGGHVHLQKGLLAGENISCTACAGTLLLEFGLLSRLTGNPAYMAAAHHAAQVLFEQRSKLGLVGSGFHVFSRTWSHRDSTIGPGSDSYYEYLLKAYLMFGDRTYLDMFTELYVATMRHMQVPGQLGASTSAFLLDVHMDSGRLLKPWVSSLGAFWPAMQVLAGQNEAAQQLHSNFTAAWATWGWLPELFGADLSAVHPEDPGYNLRPEHIESTWYLKAVSGDPGGYYGGLAASMMAVLNHSRVGCGYAPITNVNTGTNSDLMESYFLSETVKYLYLSFVDSGPLLDYYLLSTEGHIMPAFAHPSDGHVEQDLQQQQGQQQGSSSSASSDSSRDTSSSSREAAEQLTSSDAGQQAGSGCQEEEQGGGGCAPTASGNSSSNTVGSSSSSSSLVGKPMKELPSNCRALCAVRSVAEEEGYERRLRAALPLLPVRRAHSRRIRYRRCVACLHTTEALETNPPDTTAVRLARLNFGQVQQSSAGSSKQQEQQQATDPAAVIQEGTSVLSQVLCVLKVYRSGNIGCQNVRRLTALDNAVGLAAGTLVLQLTAIQPEHVAPAATVLVSFEAEEGPVTMQFPAAEASFGPQLPRLGDACVEHLLKPRERLSLLPDCLPARPVDMASYLSAAAGGSSSKSWQHALEAWETARDPWHAVTPSSRVCNGLARALRAAADIGNQQHQQQQEHDPVCEAERDHSRPVALTQQDTAAAALRAGCVGWHPASETAGTWLPAAEYMDPKGACSNNSVADAATGSSGTSTEQQQAGSSIPMAAPLVVANPIHACGSYLNNAALVRGAIVLTTRGQCSFLDKVMLASRSGAVGVVVLNLVGDGELITMSGDETGRAPDIPAVLLGKGEASQLLWWMQRRPLLGTLFAEEPAQDHVEQQQQQQGGQQQQGKGGGSGAGKRAASGSTRKHPSGYVQTRVDLYIPVRTQPWLQEHVVKQGGDTNALFAHIVKDPLVLAALQEAMVQA